MGRSLRVWLRERSLRERLVAATVLGALIVLALRQWEVSQVRSLEQAHREAQAAHAEARIVLTQLQEYYAQGLTLRWGRRVREGHTAPAVALAGLRAAGRDAEADWWFLARIMPQMPDSVRRAFAAAAQHRAAADAAARRLEEILGSKSHAKLSGFLVGELDGAVRPLDEGLEALAGALAGDELALSRAMTSRAERQQVLISLLRAATGAGVIGLIIFLFRGLDRDIARLVAHAQRMSARDFVTVLGEPPAGELRQLSRAFATMQEALADYERQLAQSEHLFQLSPDLLCIIGPDGYFRRLNPAFEATLGYTPAELKARPFIEFVHPDDVAATVAEAQKPQGEGAFSFQNRYRCKDGGHRWLSWRWRPGADGALYAVGHDVSEHRRLQEDLQQRELEARAANQAKSAFLATMSHEIRTPLVGVLGMLDVMGMSRLDAEQRRQFNIVQHSARALLEIIGDILDYSKIEAGKVELVPETFSVRDLVSSVVSVFSANAESKGLRMVQTVASEVAPAHIGDAVRIRQILANFVGNAVKFTDRGSVRLAVHVVQDGGDAQSLRFAISDTGIGIAPEQLPNLFQPFVQAESGTRRRYGGTGLGLAICSRLADLLGGSVRAESEPGHGTTMFLDLRLPRGDPAFVMAADTPAQEQVQTRRKPDREQAEREGSVLLLAEDHPVNRKVLATQFDLAGFIVDTAEDGLRALEKFAGGGYGLVFTDLHMPGLDGFQLTTAIRELEMRRQLPRTPVIALTADVLRADIERCYACGMDDYMSKPVTIRQVVDKLRRWLPSVAWDGALSEHPPAPGRVVQHSVLDEITGGNTTRALAFLRNYCRVIGGDLADLEAALRSRDGAAMRVAHRIRGAALMVGAEEVAGIAGRIEHLARESPCADLSGLGEQLRTAVARVEAYVRGLPESADAN